jgi:hypothetical protein
MVKSAAQLIRLWRRAHGDEFKERRLNRKPIRSPPESSAGSEAESSAGFQPAVSQIFNLQASEASAYRTLHRHRTPTKPEGIRKHEWLPMAQLVKHRLKSPAQADEEELEFSCDMRGSS